MREGKRHFRGGLIIGLTAGVIGIVTHSLVIGVLAALSLSVGVGIIEALRRRRIRKELMNK